MEVAAAAEVWDAVCVCILEPFLVYCLGVLGVQRAGDSRYRVEPILSFRVTFFGGCLQVSYVLLTHQCKGSNKKSWKSGSREVNFLTVFVHPN